MTVDGFLEDEFEKTTREEFRLLCIVGLTGGALRMSLFKADN